MELFCALLAGFFFWLWAFHLQRSRRARAREVAGPLLLQVKSAASIRRTFFWMRWIGVILIVATVAMKVAILLWLAAKSPMMPNLVSIGSYSFAPFFAIAAYFAILLSLAVPAGRFDIALEIREHGILQGYQLIKFTPWNKIAECRWFSPKTFWGVSLCWWMPKPFKRSRWTIVEKRIAADQKDAVTATLARFAPVYNYHGDLLAEPNEADLAARTARPALQCDRFAWQFNLQSLLLLVVAVSCAASCYGIHYRRLQPYREAVARLSAFQPVIQSIADVPIMLDFSKCTNKPADGDLVYLEPLGELWMLDLSGAAVTDAGIGHLKGLRRLTSIWLTDTQVTSKGAEELHRALPNAAISYGPSKKPVTIVPDRWKK